MKTLFSWFSHHIDISSVSYRLASKPSTAAVTIFFYANGDTGSQEMKKGEAL